MSRQYFGYASSCLLFFSAFMGHKNRSEGGFNFQHPFWDASVATEEPLMVAVVVRQEVVSKEQ